MDAVSRSMRERTGRTLQEWVDLVRAEGLDPLDQKSVRAWLKAAHALPQNTQWAVADAAARAAGWQRPSVEGYADAMYTGRKAPLRPLHEAVVAAALGLGGVQAQGRATYIPLVRHSQFAAVGPGTYGRLRIGFRFRGNVPADARLEPAKGFAQATHVIHVSAVDDDGAPTDPAALADSVIGLLRTAWSQN